MVLRTGVVHMTRRLGGLLFSRRSVRYVLSRRLASTPCNRYGPRPRCRLLVSPGNPQNLPDVALPGVNDARVEADKAPRRCRLVPEVLSAVKR